ncbi:cell wall-binding repeat-containing protein [Desulfosporosinus sp. Sb-LF]|uniref:cell wall-binding repeat-containing protein n=1 Tax=Desulfosporosinus sp. Sb-LF TaxID=2560027 RepID=UPI00107FAFB3|nr:cell wall-binding repeat-containing protein [Desulfosporosinus sp. Sb-LF]TGE31124.1 cell wall-binding repeat-containing protein [Desulfosporosinus sp. Sb-LF]
MKFQKVKILFISIIVLLSTVLPATTANALLEQYTTKRIGGQTRFDTAIEVSKEFVAKAKKPVDSVILCTAYGYADSVSVTPFAVYVNAPILLTDKEFLTPSTQARIIEMNTKKVYVIGGTGVISDNVLSTLSGMGISVERIAGVNRFDTNRLILAKIPQDLWGANPKFIDGYDVFVGLTVTVDTIEQDNTNKINPIILTDENGDENDPYSTRSQYYKNIVTTLYNIYGYKFHPFCMSSYGLSTNDKAIETYGLSFSDKLSESKLNGDSASATNNSLFASKFVSHPYATNSVLITTGLNYIDAISTGPLAAITYSPIVYKLPSNNYYYTFSSAYKACYNDVQTVYYIGGSVVVPDGSESILK